MQEIKIGRFTLNYEDIAKYQITKIIIGKPKKYRIKACWDENFNRTYKIYKEIGVSIVEEFGWIPSLMGSINLPDSMPQYISELLYDLYNFEFPNNGEKNDITVKSFFNSKENLSNKTYGYLLKVRMESLLSKKLDFIGPAGIFCNCGIMDLDDNFVTKTFRIHDNSISFNTGIVDEKNPYPENSIGSINGGSYIFKNIEQTDLIINNLKV